MHFSSPFFLFALFALAIPLIVHLFNFRKFRKIYFSNVRFLQELQQKTKKQSELKHLLIMLSRMLVIASLVIAFARPYFPAEGSGAQQSADSYVSIYIDNSFSMDAQGSEGLLLDVAKLKALEIASIHLPSDRYQLITNDFEGKHRQFVSREEFIEMVNEVGPSPVSRLISDVFRRQRDLLSQKKTGKGLSYLLSDYQKTTADISAIPADTSIRVMHIPVKPVSYDNAYIDSCWFDSPYFRTGQQLQLHVSIFNASGNIIEKLPVRLMVNGAQRAVATIDIDAWSNTVALLSYIANDEGIQNAVIEITDFPVTYDDTFFLSYSVSSVSHILVVYNTEPAPALKALFEKDSAFAVTWMSLRALNYGSFPSHSLIILDELNEISSGLESELVRYLTEGGNLFIIPSEKPDFESYNRLLAKIEMPLISGIDSSGSRVGFVDFQHLLFRDVFDNDMLRRMTRERIDLPVAKKYFRTITGSRSKAQMPVRLESDAPFLLSRPTAKGNIYMLTVPLSPSFGNFTRHSLFVILVYRTALLSERISQLYLIPGKYEDYSLPEGRLSGDKVFKLKSLDNSIEIIPSQKRVEIGASIGLQGQLSKAGNYLLYKGDSLLAGVAVNYDRNESDLRAYNTEEIKTEIKAAGLKNHQVVDGMQKEFIKSITTLTNARYIWKWFLLLALFFMAAEIALIRLWK